MAEWVIKYSEWLTQTREWSAYKYFAMGRYERLNGLPIHNYFKQIMKNSSAKFSFH